MEHREAVAARMHEKLVINLEDANMAYEFFADAPCLDLDSLHEIDLEKRCDELFQQLPMPFND